ncbi:MAG: T9SS type A sorting domain-containing protein [Ignavibacteriota bacterium]
MIFLAIAIALLMSSSKAQISWVEKFPWRTLDGKEYNFLSFSARDKQNFNLLGYYADSTLRYANTVFVQRSTDGGNSWQIQKTGVPDFPTIQGAHLKKIFAIDSLNVIAVGDSGLIVRTTDAGNSWNRQGKKLDATYRDVNFSDPDHGIAVGGWGTVSITSDGGNSWNTYGSLSSTLFNRCKAFKNGCFYVFDQYYMRFFRTYDNGATWDSIQIVDRSIKDKLWNFITDIQCFDSLNIIAVGGHERPLGSGSTPYAFYAIKTTDGGNSWTQLLDSNYCSSELRSVSFTDSLLGVASSVGGYVILTRDGGKTWDLNIVDSTHLYVNGIYFVDNKYLFAIYSIGFYSAVMSGTLEDASVASNSLEFVNSSRVYPNPSSGMFIIESIDRTGAPIRITDIFGREVAHGKLSEEGKLKLDLSSVPAGVYEILLDHYGKVFSVGRVVSLGSKR